jgi:hypothetical protein
MAVVENLGAVSHSLIELIAEPDAEPEPEADWTGFPLAYWQWRLTDQGRDVSVVHAVLEFECFLADWLELDNKYDIICEFNHMGPLVGVRKVLSYAGVPDGHGDQGNWVYAVVLRALGNGVGPHDWRLEGVDCLNDEHAGDILEAIWGLLSHRRLGEYLTVLPRIALSELEEYGNAMSRAVLSWSRMWPRFLSLGEWPTSRYVAACLC